MKKSDKLKQKRSLKKTERRKLLDQIAKLRESAETRQLTDEEKTLITQIKAQAEAIVEEVEELDVQVEEAEEEEREMEEEEKRKSPSKRQNAPVDHAVSDISDEEKRNIRNYSIARAMRAASNPKHFDGFEKEMHDEGMKEYRAAGVTNAGSGVVVPTMVLRHGGLSQRAMSVTGGTSGNKGGVTLRDEPIDYIELLKAKTPLVDQYGVQMISGLQGDLPLVRQSAAVQFGWKGEVADADETDMTLLEYKMTPHRLTGQIFVSDQLLIQSSLDIEGMINADILSSHAVTLQSAAINGAGSGSDQPLGILNDPDVIALVLGAAGGLLDWEKVQNLIQALDDQNHLMDDPKFLLATVLRTALKTGSIDAGSGLKIWDLITNRIDGYYADTSNIVPKDLSKGGADDLAAILFGNWSDYILGMWGGMEIIYDPYTRAKNAQKVYTLNVFHDGVARRPKSFAYYKDVIPVATGAGSVS